MSDPVVAALLESDAAGKSRVEMARILGVQLETLNQIEEEFNKQVDDKDGWTKLVQEKRSQRTATAANWDDLEHAATSQLLQLVEGGRVKQVSDLLAISRVANAAHRNGVFAPSTTNQPKGDEQGQLPGGKLGTIELRLTTAAAESIQISEAEVVEGDYEVIRQPQKIRDLAARFDHNGDSVNPSGSDESAELTESEDA